MRAKTLRGPIFRLLLLVVILLAACQKEDALRSQPTPPPQAPKKPSAMDAARVLKAEGIPFLNEYKGVSFPIDSSPGTPGSILEVSNTAGILSSATTATTNADSRYHRIQLTRETRAGEKAG